MTRRRIAFEQVRTDVVAAVLIVVDGVTRRPVRSRLGVLLWDPVRGAARPGRLIRNLSGHVVLVNESPDQDLTFRIDPADAGYRGPLFVTFNPARDGVSRVVALEPRPDRAFDDGTTLVRGSVVRSAGGGTPTHPLPVAGLTVTARPRTGSAGHQFPATTDERGVFALAVGLKLAATAEGPAPVPTLLRLEKPGLPVREFTLALDEGRTHILAEPVDLDRDDPPRFTPSGTTGSRRSTRS
ncbi:hypothetical protein [Actinopolymorpha rutila]|uniref:Uncharacterized protein n=1 Tax=Actinopolymorpha rutila TaxID=446787 RepID=A0A852ZH32_9ACTN|nr:hypothetical protein [Actinopolymorpha rutila]NYH92461.1 hypothetical protein [Actinopolymorpha rutila]